IGPPHAARIAARWTNERDVPSILAAIRRGVRAPRGARCRRRRGRDGRWRQRWRGGGDGGPLARSDRAALRQGFAALDEAIAGLDPQRELAGIPQLATGQVGPHAGDFAARDSSCEDIHDTGSAVHVPVELRADLAHAIGRSVVVLPEAGEIERLAERNGWNDE